MQKREFFGTWIQKISISKKYKWPAFWIDVLLNFLDDGYLTRDNGIHQLVPLCDILFGFVDTVNQHFYTLFKYVVDPNQPKHLRRYLKHEIGQNIKQKAVDQKYQLVDDEEYCFFVPSLKYEKVNQGAKGKHRHWVQWTVIYGLFVVLIVINFFVLYFHPSIL